MSATAATTTEKVQISIAEALGGHHNSLGFLRLVLASLVIFDHAFPLGGFGTDIFWGITRQQASLGSIAVAGFFAISGYLIAKSGIATDVVQFLWRRILRIFPAYWTVLLLTALVIAPIIWVTAGRALSEYFTLAPNGPVNYFTANWTLNIGAYGIYDIFANTTPYGQEVHASVFNGSIWTLIYEFNCYLLIALAVAFGVLTRARILIPIATAFLFAIQIVVLTAPSGLATIAPYFADNQRIFLTFTFLVGSTLAVYSRKIPFDHRLGILSGVVLVLTLRYGGFSTIGVVAGVYFVMYIAAALPKAFQRVGAKNDYSYGVYIYGFLVQQILAYLGVYRWGYLPFTLIALVAAYGFAWLSWHFVEKRAMALKDWGPGRGWQYWQERVRDWRLARREQRTEAPASYAQPPAVVSRETNTEGRS